MDTAQWPQEIVVKPIEEIVTSTCPKPPQLQPPPPSVAAPPNSTGISGGGVERKVRPQKDQALNCPRCNSTNTKFCYYNNYSLTQPRYFCKTCRRYWTEGGSLRNIPVGGGSRKNKRSSSSSPSPSSISSSPSSASSTPKKHHLVTKPPVSSTPGFSGQNPKTHETQDLNLAFSQGFRNSCNITEFVHVPSNLNIGSDIKNNPLVSSSSCSSSSSIAAATAGTNSSTAKHLSALELLTGMSQSPSSSTFMALPTVQDPIGSTVYTTSGFSFNYPTMQEFIRPSSLNFSVDGGGGGGYGHEDHLQQEEGGAGNGRLLFPFESLRLPVSSSGTSSDNNMDNQQEKEQGDHSSAGFWTGMLGGGVGGSWHL